MTVEVLPHDTYNDSLVANVHPPDWVNPQPAPRYNLVVVGAGTAGLITAAGAAGLGARVALVERELMGGDCLNVGCVPSKALIRASRACAHVRDAGPYGVKVPQGVQVDFPAVMQRMHRLRAEIAQNDSATRYRKLGVDVFLGNARFTSPDTIDVEGQTLRFRKAVIATGGRAAKPPIPGLAEAGLLTNETLFSLTQLPTHLAVIGAGPMGCEMAQAFARFGSEVFLLEARSQILPREDPDAAGRVQKSIERDGVKLLLGCTIRDVQLDGQEKVIRFDGDCPDLRVDEILVGTGRVPNVDGLNLKLVGVRFDPRQGVRVNDRLQTTNPSIYAVGDVCFPFKFTHIADATARIVLRNALFRGRAKASALTVPWCTYTDPEIAHVGWYERDLREKDIPFRTFVQEFKDVDRAVLDGEPEGLLKVHVRKGTDRILGATLVASHAGEMISELTLAMVGGLGLRTLAETIHPYPTQAEAIKKIADAYNRTRLTARAKSLFQTWFAWTR